MDNGTGLVLKFHVHVWSPEEGELLPRDKAASALYEIEDSFKKIIEKHGLTYVGCGYGISSER